jgi:hypothetical protein
MSDLFPDDDWVKAKADPDKPIWLVFYTQVAQDEISNFITSYLGEAGYQDEFINWHKEHNMIFLGSFSTPDEAEAFKNFAILKRAKDYTPHISHAIEVNATRPFLAHVQTDNLVKYESYVYTNAHDYKILRDIIQITPVENTDSIDDAWKMLVVNDLNRFRGIGLKRTHFVKLNVPTDNIPSILTKLVRIVDGWKHLCLQTKLIAGGADHLKTNAIATAKAVGFDLDDLDPMIQCYRDNPELNYALKYPGVKIDGKDIEYF